MVRESVWEFDTIVSVCAEDTALLESNRSAVASLTSGQRATRLCSLSFYPDAQRESEKLIAHLSQISALKMNFFRGAIIQSLV